jgi:deoxycytidylate deaminase
MSSPEPVSLPRERQVKSKDVVSGYAAHELVFAVVGHVGSGTTEIAEDLKAALVNAEYDVTLLKASQLIGKWASQNTLPISEKGSLKRAIELQDAGDKMRSKDFAAVAVALVRAIRETRAEKTGTPLSVGVPIQPDGVLRAYVIDSIRHPAEVELLRRIYGHAFGLIGVVCQEDVRKARLSEKYPGASGDDIAAFMGRDAKAPQKFGQRVSDSFHMADYFVDNTPSRKLADGRSNVDWTISEQLSRLVKIVEHTGIQRPYVSETAMFLAHGARLRSSCLSRQVGAALLDAKGDVISTGYNDVPKAGGGICGPGFEDLNTTDGRCLHGQGCRSVTEQRQIAVQIATELPELKPALLKDRDELIDRLLDTRLGALIEFSRAVHAEMECLLAAARRGHATRGTTMFVTTFPCHFCARHIISAGVDQVQYIEPYPKSRAMALHSDAITAEPTGWKPASEGGDKVLLRPFTGVAPRLYARAFLKDRELKNDVTGEVSIGVPEWGPTWYIAKASYAEMEAKVSQGS